MDGARIWPLSDQPPEQWQAAFNDGVGMEVTGPLGGPGPRLTAEGVVWAVPPADSEAADAIVKAWVDKSNRAYEDLMADDSRWLSDVIAMGR